MLLLPTKDYYEQCVLKGDSNYFSTFHFVFLRDIKIFNFHIYAWIITYCSVEISIKPQNFGRTLDCYLLLFFS